MVPKVSEAGSAQLTDGWEHGRGGDAMSKGLSARSMVAWRGGAGHYRMPTLEFYVVPDACRAVQETLFGGRCDTLHDSRRKSPDIATPSW